MSNLEQIRKGLKRHRGAFLILAERTGKSHNLVRSVMRGDRSNVNVVLEAAKLWRELETKKREALSQADAIAQELAHN